MALATQPFDPADYLGSPEARAAYLEDAFASNDAAEITEALGVVARAAGMSGLAAETGLKREALYRSLSAKGNPGLRTILEVMKALGLQLAPVQVK